MPSQDVMKSELKNLDYVQIMTYLLQIYENLKRYEYNLLIYFF